MRRGLGHPPAEDGGEHGVLATGLAPLDACLPGGGLPEGRLAEVVGRTGCGRLTLALAIARGVLARGEPVALVDPDGTLRPDARAEPLLASLLVVRGGGIATALRAADVLLRTGAFPLVVLDLPGRAKLATGAFVRLARETRLAGSVLLLVSEWLPWRMHGLASLVSLRLEVERPRPCGRRPPHGLLVLVAKSKLGREGARSVVEVVA